MFPRLVRLNRAAMNFRTLDANRLAANRVPIVKVPIRTIYEPGDTSSHFNPLVDSMKNYFVLLRFSSVSLMTALLDSVVFTLCGSAPGWCWSRRSRDGW